MVWLGLAAFYRVSGRHGLKHGDQSWQALSAEMFDEVRSADAEHAVRGEGAASGNGGERRPHDEGEVGGLAAPGDLEEGELLLARDRGRGGRPVRGQQVQADGPGQRRADLSDCWWSGSSVGEAEFDAGRPVAAGTCEVSDSAHGQDGAELAWLEVPAGCQDRDGCRVRARAADEPEFLAGLLVQHG